MNSRAISIHDKPTNSYRAPFAPSIDRINSEKGYTDGNVRLVCVAVNWALSDWGIEVFEKICSSVGSKLLFGGAKTGLKTGLFNYYD